MHLRVADDAQRMRTRGQRDQPEPVARAAHVVGRTPAVRRREPLQPRRIVRPLVGIDGAVDPPPHRVGVVVVGLRQAELALEQAGAAGGIDHPAGRQRLRLAILLVADRMRGVACAQFDAAHDRAIDERDAERARLLAEEILEAAAVQLPRRRRQQLADAQLDAVVDVAAAIGEEVAQPELADLLGFQVLAETEHVGEVMRADLDRGFADLERGLAHRVRAAFEHAHVDVGIALPQLDREGEAGEAAAEDGDVVDGHASLNWRAARAATRRRCRIRRWDRRSPADWRGCCDRPQARRRGAAPAARCGG